MGPGLVTPNMKWEIILGGAIVTNQLPFTATFENIFPNKDSTFATLHGTSNSAAAVTVISAPRAGEQRLLQFLSIYNDDTAIATVTFRLNDNATTRKIVVMPLDPGEGLFYDCQNGFYVL